MKPSAEQVSALAKSEHDQLRDEIRALTEQNKLLENELVAVSAERDMWKEKYATTRENFIAHVFKAVEGDGK